MVGNGLREGDAWQYINSFVDVIRAVAVALAQLLPPAARRTRSRPGGRAAGQAQGQQVAAAQRSGPSGRQGWGGEVEEEEEEVAAWDPLLYCLERTAAEYNAKFENFNGPMRQQRGGMIVRQRR